MDSSRTDVASPARPAVEPVVETGWRGRVEPVPVALFCAVTLFIWGNRIWLAWTNPDDTVGEKLVWSTPITLFVVAAVLLGGFMVGGGDRTDRRFALGVTGFAVGTTLYWGIRMPMIWTADHPAAFMAVHSVLAVVSVALAVKAWLSIRSL
ncbi:MAG: hypothetical protein H6519_03450 [Microthrixaceae bacterium]|nr:hypothetical protein [Acidimicrobiales bacterium]MCB9403471.1 hypothetical protein [Microthrixaceae bacterium]